MFISKFNFKPTVQLWCLFEKASQLCITKPNFIIYEPLLTCQDPGEKKKKRQFLISTLDKLSEWYKPENPYMMMDLEWLQNYKLMIFIKVNLTKCCDCLVVISSSGTNKKTVLVKRDPSSNQKRHGERTSLNKPIHHCSIRSYQVCVYTYMHSKL